MIRALALFGIVLTALPAMAADADAGLIAKAMAAQSQGKDELAIRLAQSAIVADPTKTAGYFALGDIYRRQNFPDYARDFYQQALDINPQDSTAKAAFARLNGAATTTAAADTLDKPNTRQ
jgi:tetratricopeptide (TPR) repeat protein